MFIRIILNIFLDTRCILCNKRLKTDRPGHVCAECMDYFKTSDRARCTVCGHPARGTAQCPSCSRLGKIYFDSFSFVQYYTGFLKKMIVMLKLNQKYRINDIFYDLALKKGLVENDGIITVVPDNFFRRMKKGRAGLHYLLKLFKSGNFRIMDGIYKKRMSLFNSQKMKNDYGRLSKIGGLFYLPEKNINKFGGKVYLVDDIYTTGATVNYGARLLKQAGFSEVHVITFFRSVLDN